MRPAQAFNGIDHVPVEANINGVRIRILGMVSLLLSLSLLILLSLWSPLVGIPVGGFLLLTTIGGIFYLSRLDPDGTLSESTQIRIIISGFRNRIQLAQDTEGVDD